MSLLVESDTDAPPSRIRFDGARAAERIDSMPIVGTPSIDDLGNVVVFHVLQADVSSNTYRCTMWISRNGAQAEELFCAGDSSGSSPQVSPDGRWVLFARAPHDGGPSQLFVADLAGSVHAQITTAELGVNSGVWSPQGDAVAYVTRTDLTGAYTGGRVSTDRRYLGVGGFADGFGATIDRPRRIEAVAPFADNPTPWALAPCTEDATAPAWSPDGRALAYVVSTSPDGDLNARNAIAIVDVSGADRRVIVAGDTVKGGPEFTADGSTVLFAAEVLDADGVPSAAASFGVWSVDVASGLVSRLTDAEPHHIGFSCQTQRPVPGGFVAGIDSRGATELVRFDQTGAVISTLIGGRRQVNGFAVARPDGRVRVAAVVTSPATAGDVVIADDDGERAITAFGSALTTRCPIYEPERFVADVDGYQIEGWKVLPEGPGPHPVVLTIKGGPFTQFGYTLQGPAALDDAQVYADSGIATILVNPRGTSGYGQAHGEAAWPLAESTQRDLLAAVTYAMATDDRLDPGRVGVMGGSFGGYMTAWLAAKAPELFRAGICERGVYDIDSFAAAGDDGWNTACALYGTDRTTWADQSPVTFADDIALPLLVMHSEQDGHCPFEQARRLLFEMRIRRQPVELVAFAGETHELSRTGDPVNRVARLATIVEWWGRHLASAPRNR
ncbi:S9 family peptidase [Williamsia sp. MIQD14]|uniref:S9 family peptidase n=1 Tax=Williamsia sp. MIQD14 TaxID=3425703 RepID=UPI003DA1B2EF